MLIMTAFHNQFQIFDNAQPRSLSWFSAVPEWNRAVVNVIIYTCAKRFLTSKLGNVSVKMSVVMISCILTAKTHWQLVCITYCVKYSNTVGTLHKCMHVFPLFLNCALQSHKNRITVALSWSHTCTLQHILTPNSSNLAAWSVVLSLKLRNPSTPLV